MAGLIYECSIPQTALYLFFMKNQPPLFTLSVTKKKTHFNVGLLFFLSKIRSEAKVAFNISNLVLLIFFTLSAYLGISACKITPFCIHFTHSRYNQQNNGKYFDYLCIKKHLSCFSISINRI